MGATIGLGADRALTRRVRGRRRHDDTIVTNDTYVTSFARLSSIVACALACAGCNGLLDIHDLSVAPEAGDDGGVDAIEGGGDACASLDDPRNCGACGHDCLGGECVAGACQPVKILDTLSDPRSIAADDALDGNVWVADSTAGTIWRVAKDGSSSEQVRWAATGFSPTSLKVDDARLYWIETRNDAASGQDVVFQTNKSDLGARVVSPTTWTWLRGLDVDADGIFFVNARGSDLVMRAPVGLSPVTTILHGPSTATREAIAVVPGASQLFFGGTDGLWTMREDGSGLRQIFTVGEVTTIALDESRVWFASGDALFWQGLDGTCPADGCDGRWLARRSDATNVSIAVDHDHVYWTHPFDGLLRAVKDVVGVPAIETMASVEHVGGIALDFRAIYFTSPGAVWRLAK